MRLSATLRSCFSAAVTRPAGRCAVLGMVHVPALPGTPGSRMSVAEIVRAVERESAIYRQCGVDGIVVENMHDTPYVRRAGPEVTAVMTRACEAAVRGGGGLPVGVQVLASNNSEALAVALAGGGCFVRCEGFVFGHLADEGYTDACAGELLRYRKHIGAEHISIIADIKKKHSSHALTADVSLAETALAAQFFRADGVVVTGDSTGREPGPQQLTEVMEAAPSLPLVVGSGVTADNLRSYAGSHAVVVGSHFKRGGSWDAELCPETIERFMREAGNIAAV